MHPTRIYRAYAMPDTRLGSADTEEAEKYPWVQSPIEKTDITR